METFLSSCHEALQQVKIDALGSVSLQSDGGKVVFTPGMIVYPFLRLLLLFTVFNVWPMLHSGLMS